MNSTFLRTFVVLAETGSYTKTAQKMITVPSTVSKQIKLLEQETGKELVLRGKKGIRLTKSGEIFLSYARRILTEEDSCFRELDEVRARESDLRIGAVTSLFMGHVSDWLIEAIRGETAVNRTLYTGHSHLLLNNLYDGEIDICFTYRPFRENNCECIPFVRDEMIFVTGGENDYYPQGITVSEISRLPLIKESQLSVAAPALYREIFDQAGNMILSVTTGNYIIPYLKAGNGYGFVVRHYVEKELASGELRQVPINGISPIYLQSYLVYKKANPVVTDTLLDSLSRFIERHKA